MSLVQNPRQRGNLNLPVIIWAAQTESKVVAIKMVKKSFAWVNV